MKFFSWNICLTILVLLILDECLCGENFRGKNSMQNRRKRLKKKQQKAAIAERKLRGRIKNIDLCAQIPERKDFSPIKKLYPVPSPNPLKPITNFRNYNRSTLKVQLPAKSVNTSESSTSRPLKVDYNHPIYSNVPDIFSTKPFLETIRMVTNFTLKHEIHYHFYMLESSSISFACLEEYYPFYNLHELRSNVFNTKSTPSRMHIVGNSSAIDLSIGFLCSTKKMIGNIFGNYEGLEGYEKALKYSFSYIILTFIRQCFRWANGCKCLETYKPPSDFLLDPIFHNQRAFDIQSFMDIYLLPRIYFVKELAVLFYKPFRAGVLPHNFMDLLFGKDLNENTFSNFTSSPSFEKSFADKFKVIAHKNYVECEEIWRTDSDMRSSVFYTFLQVFLKLHYPNYCARKLKEDNFSCMGKWIANRISSIEKDLRCFKRSEKCPYLAKSWKQISDDSIKNSP